MLVGEPNADSEVDLGIFVRLQFASGYPQEPQSSSRNPEGKIEDSIERRLLEQARLKEQNNMAAVLNNLRKRGAEGESLSNDVSSKDQSTRPMSSRPRYGKTPSGGWDQVNPKQDFRAEESEHQRENSTTDQRLSDPNPNPLNARRAVRSSRHRSDKKSHQFLTSKVIYPDLQEAKPPEKAINQPSRPSHEQPLVPPNAGIPGQKVQELDARTASRKDHDLALPKEDHSDILCT